MTNHWNDIKNADVILIMGGNAAVAHPVGFKYVTEAMENRGAKLVVVDPRFTQSAAVADLYAPLRSGTDIAFLGGVINYLLANNKVHAEYVKAYTNATVPDPRRLTTSRTASSRATTSPSAATTRRAGATRSATTASRWSTRRWRTRTACGNC